MNSWTHRDRLYLMLRFNQQSFRNAHFNSKGHKATETSSSTLGTQSIDRAKLVTPSPGKSVFQGNKIAHRVYKVPSVHVQCPPQTNTTTSKYFTYSLSRKNRVNEMNFAVTPESSRRKCSCVHKAEYLMHTGVPLQNLINIRVRHSKEYS